MAISKLGHHFAERDWWRSDHFITTINAPHNFSIFIKLGGEGFLGTGKSKQEEWVV